LKLYDWRLQADGAAPTLRVAEFGCGSGNVALPLAALLPQCRFTLVDRNAFAVQLAQQRAAAAGLANVDRFHACAVADVRCSFPRCVARSPQLGLTAV
jgi:16S rRNA G1207 methylase RsmC